MTTRSLLLGSVLALAAGLLAALPAMPAAATPRAAAAPQPDPGRPDRSTVDPAVRDAVLPPGWRSSPDVAWTTDGDATGFHLLVAAARTGYTWRTAATLAEPWIATDRWVGSACLTGSGRRAVVVYAPRHFTNRAHLFDRGAFAAVVDLATGAVTKLGVTVSLAYYNPGCGTGETAVLTQSGAVDLGRTRLHVLDAERGALVRSHELAGEVTSAVPLGDNIVAADGGRLVEVAPSGSVRELARTNGVAFRLHPDGGNGVVFTEREAETAVVRRLSGAAVRELARGPLTGIRVVAGAGGRVFLTGAPTSVGDRPAAVTRLDVPVRAEVSSTGQVSLTRADQKRTAAVPPDPNVPRALSMRARVAGTGRDVDFVVDPGGRVGEFAGQGRAVSPAAAGAGAGATAESPTDPVDQDRTCSIPRNDMRLQVYQPHWSQVEWAADLAVQGQLTVQRPANWKLSGMPVSWSPQQMFQPVSLAGGGRVPVQVLLGVLAQESNLWQASPHVAEGVTGNPLVSAYYGTRDGWGIDWVNADCGYGVAQVTDGMRRIGSPLLPPEQQRAVAVDYATNIAAGLRILQQKWNQTNALSVRVNGANPARIETWFAALWAYNSGINPQASTGNTSGCTPSPTCTDADGNYGLGWFNNPANPDYPPDRAPFLDFDNYDDARFPQWWPYPEKVIGWAAYPIVKYTGGDGYEAGYAQAWWVNEHVRTGAKPPLGTFCSMAAGTGNHCDPGRIGQGPNPCTRSDFHCWWHSDVQWKDCSSGTDPCGHETNVLTPPGTPEPPDADASGAYPDESRPRYRPNCSLSGLPSGALVIDDVPASVPSVRPNCERTWTNSGTFGMNFAQHGDGLYHSKVDFHQIGGGFGGHFWFAHTHTPNDDAANNWRVTGTWTLNQAVNGWARVLVHMPDHGAHTQQAPYTVHLGNGTTKFRSLLQKTQAHKWVPLGVFRFAGTPKVSLTNVTAKADGTDDVAFDAVAFQLLPGKPANQIVVLGDSYTSGSGASTDARVDYYRETDDDGFGDPAYRNGCHRSRHAWSRQAVLPDLATEAIGSRADRFDPGMDYHLLACAGAQTEHLLPDDGETTNAFGDRGTGAHLELSQYDRGFLDENTTMVALTIGGNDARWADVVSDCTAGSPLPETHCQSNPLYGVDPDWFPEPPPPGTDLRYENALPMLINGPVKDSIETVLRAVHERAPNARIVLAGYPRLFPIVGDGSRWYRDVPCMISLGLNDSEIDFLNDMGDLLNDVQHELVVTLSNDGIQVSYSDPRDEFELENICSNVNPGNETIHRVVVAKTGGEAPGPGVSQQSFHPTIAGARNYADAFVATLRATLPGHQLPAPPSKQVAAAELYELQDYAAGSSTGYDPSLFGDWTTVTPGCNTRFTVLRRDDHLAGSACPTPSSTGRWISPYDNTQHTSPATVGIDHIVAKKEAWRSGANRWTPEKRRTFANDIEHPQLVAVSTSSNSSKNDWPPDVWLPAVTYWCTYARAWIHTKRIYHLSVTQAEYDTLKEILDTRC